MSLNYSNQQIHKQIVFISSLFILYLLLSYNPFVHVKNSSEIVGLGLIPILQLVLFVIHPPTLFLSYIGLIIPFVLASHSSNLSI